MQNDLTFGPISRIALYCTISIFVVLSSQLFAHYLYVVGEGGIEPQKPLHGFPVNVGSFDGFVVLEHTNPIFSEEYAELFFPVHGAREMGPSFRPEENHGAKTFEYFEGKHPQSRASTVNLQTFLLQNLASDVDEEQANFLASMELTDVVQQVKAGLLDPHDYFGDQSRYHEKFSDRGHWDPRYWFQPANAGIASVYLIQRKHIRIQKAFAQRLEHLDGRTHVWVENEHSYSLLDISDTSSHGISPEIQPDLAKYRVTGYIGQYDQSDLESFRGLVTRKGSEKLTTMLASVSPTMVLEESHNVDYRVRVAGSEKNNVPVVVLHTDYVKYIIGWNPTTALKSFVVPRESFMNVGHLPVPVYLVDSDSLFIPKKESTDLFQPSKNPRAHIEHLYLYSIKMGRNPDPAVRYGVLKDSVRKRIESREFKFERLRRLVHYPMGIGVFGDCRQEILNFVLTRFHRFRFGY